MPLSNGEFNMSKPSHCQKCGLKFSWYWRHRHICARCGRVVCDNCSENIVYISERVRNLDFEKEELCNDCEQVNTEELEDGELIVIINAYEIGYEKGYDEGYREGRHRGYEEGYNEARG